LTGLTVHWREITASIVGCYALVLTAAWLIYKRGGKSKESRANALIVALFAPLSLVVMGVASLGVIAAYLIATSD
jgi:hypothetical protein